MANYTVKLQDDRFDNRGLGRLVEHDERSRQYTFDAAKVDVKSVHHQRRVPVLDQGSIGACTGNAMTGLLGTVPFFATLPKATLSTTDGKKDEKVAIGLYSAATKLDAYPGSYPPDDTGSSGVAVAKAAKAKGWISGYQHTFNLSSALKALSTTPVIIGINWYEGFDSPAADGGLAIAGSVRGGHEVVLDQLDVENKRVWLTNSWGTTFGLAGRGYFTWATFERLLSESGDCTVPVPITAPPPTPKPPAKPSAADKALWDASKTWARARGLLT